MVIDIPYNFKLRPYQVPIYEALERGYKRAIAVWHRRAGKDKVFINILAREALKRVGIYFYILPYYTQTRKVIWKGADKTGFPLLGHFPDSIVKRKSDQEMTIELINGSILWFLGSDNIDSIVGANPVGVIFSEFSVHKPAAWNFLRPILLENEGWALFNGTPRGKNHLWKLLESARHDPDWLVDIRTIDDTHVMTHGQVEKEIALGMPRALAQQEFYCSFDAAMTGAYYGDQINFLFNTNHITNLNWDSALPVNTAWDLGINDMTTIWLFQTNPNTNTNTVNVIDCIADSGRSLQHYIKLLNDTPYNFGYHLLPHDIKQRELTSGRSRLDIVRSLGLRNATVVKKLSVEDGIAAARSLLPRCYFDAQRCAKGIEALKQYRAAYDEENEVYGAPIHDWSSHYADAFRMLAVGLKDQTVHTNPSKAVDMDYNPIGQYNESFNRNDRRRQSSYLDARLDYCIQPAWGW